MERLARRSWLSFRCYLAAVGLLIALSEPGLAQPWRVTSNVDGIEVSEREVKDRNLPVFRGRTLIDGHPLEILGVLQDLPNTPRWMHRCMEARSVEQLNADEHISYNRTDAPWPVQDRDVVLHSRVKFNPTDGTIHVAVRSIEHPTTPPIDGVVRMKRLRGHFTLKRVSENKTHVEYQIDAHPGGWLPGWLIRMTTEDIPRDTLKALTRRVTTTQKNGMYSGFIERVRSRFEQSAVEPKENEAASETPLPSVK